jgi:hypothetical protein
MEIIVISLSFYKDLNQNISKCIRTAMTQNEHDTLQFCVNTKEIPPWISLQKTFYRAFQKDVPVRLMGTRFTNAITCFKPGPQEPYREILFIQ